MAGNGKVFLSHTNDGHEHCTAIYTYLTSKGVDCWYDVHNMAPGQILTTEMQREIAARDVFVRVCTPQATTSYYMQLERDLLTALQAAEYQTEHRRLAISLCFAGYPVEPLDRITKYIDASSSTMPQAAWLDELRRALDLPMGWVLFDKSNDDYLWWIKTYPHGWVVNADWRPRPDWLTLHYAACGNIASYSPGAGYTYVGGATIKICALDRNELAAWAVSQVGPEATLSPCGSCMWKETAR